MSVLAQATARGDILLRRGVTTEWGVRWEHSSDGGKTYELVNMTGWIGTLELRSPAGDVWLTLALEPGNGLCRVVVPADALASPEWAARSSGTWLVNVTDAEGQVDRLGDGYFYMEG